MSTKLKISLLLAIILIVSFFVWKFVGKPYYKINLLGTEYIENSEELSYVNELVSDKLYLIKKYKYSEDKHLFKQKNQSATTNYYAYGVADKNKVTLIEPKYQFISSKTNSKKEPIIFGLPYVEKGNEKMMHFKIQNNKIELISEKESW